MTGTIQKWGNSQALRIPKSILDALGLKENDTIELFTEADSIIIRKSHKHKTFAERMEGYTGDYVFSEMDSGDPVGREVF